MSTIGRKVVIAITGLLLSGFFACSYGRQPFHLPGSRCIQFIRTPPEIARPPFCGSLGSACSFLFLIHMGLAISLVQRSALGTGLSRISIAIGDRHRAITHHGVGPVR